MHRMIEYLIFDKKTGLKMSYILKFMNFLIFRIFWKLFIIFDLILNLFLLNIF